MLDDSLSVQQLLEHEIQYFLLCAARWTTRWFNKPKFHILIHLPDHIRRFGPAILFATEAFESFNAIIRAKSIHSNRHAPSRDIARAFAQGNRIRHLLSGGKFSFMSPIDLLHPHVQPNPTNVSASSARTQILHTLPTLPRKETIVSAGEGPLGIVAGENTVTSYLGLEGKKAVTVGETSSIISRYSCLRLSQDIANRIRRTHGLTTKPMQGVSYRRRNLPMPMRRTCYLEPVEKFAS